MDRWSDTHIAVALQQALLDGEIVAAYQPKVTLSTRELIGVEALARWTSPTLGSIPPERFIPIAEDQGLIAELTRTILEDALATCAQLRQHVPTITMAVNISPLLLADISFVDQIDDALRQAGVPPSALVAEITEGRAIQNVKRAGSALAALRQRGIARSIDDFGTGHASLLTLLRLPFSELKIDRAFIAACVSDPEAQMIVRATLGLAREMQLHVVAEGIETEDTESLLLELGCISGQGFRYGRPIGSTDLLASLVQPGRCLQFNA